MKVIGFGHRQRVGKDTAVKFALSHLRMKGISCDRLSMGDEIKDQAYRMFSWTGLQPGIYYENNPKYKDEILPTIGKSPRQIYIELGNAGRAICPKVWNELAYSKFECDVALISDLRDFPDIEFVKKFSGFVFRIDRIDKAPINDATDSLLKDYDHWDGIIENDGSLKDFGIKIRSLVDQCLSETEK